MAKVSPRQQKILDRMAEGWELCQAMGPNSFCWLSLRGDASKFEPVRFASIRALREKGLIVVESSKFPTRTYILKEERKE